MLKKIKRTFILISMLTIIMTIGVFFTAITYSNYKKATEKADTLTNIICNNNGQIPEYKNTEFSSKEKEFVTPESRFSTRYIVVYIDNDGEILYKDMSHIASVSEKEAEEYAKKIVCKKRNTGCYKNLRYRIKNIDDGKMVVLLDFNGDLVYLRNTTARGILIIIIGLICIFIIISILSNKALKPMEETLEKQKQFITNAGHDLKTPIAVILANTEVLEMTLGEDNEWVNSIQRQAKKMDNLTKGLLNMSKIEDGNFVPDKVNFKICNMIDEEVKDFKAVAKEKNVKINFEKNDLIVKADKNLCRQLIVILIDNGIKYVDENGTIDIEVKRNKKQIKIDFINDYKDCNNFNSEKVFDRFYRGDKSRNSEKNIGYGIGLSMAKSIVEAHNGKIKAWVTKDNRVCFEVLLEAGNIEK